MKIVILLHSATGNTRVVTRHAAAHLRRAGHDCVVHDIVKQPAPLSLAGVELLGVACPTMYFRPTFAMQAFVERLPASPGPRPAFLLATAGGEPGAHFEILSQLLTGKGFGAIGAHWVISPDSWPPHHNVVRPLAALAPTAARLTRLGPRQLRGMWALAWPGVGDPDAEDRAHLVMFLDRIVTAARGELRAPPPEALHHAQLRLDALGRLITREKIAPYSRPRFDAARCDGCGTCVAACPARIITQASERAVPTVAEGCSGCFACYNRCPAGAISAWASPAGKAQYHGPSAAMRELFAATDAGDDEI